MQIIEQLNNLQLGDLVWWREHPHDNIVIGFVAEMFDDDHHEQALWKAEFTDGEHCYWGEFYHDFVEEGMMGALEQNDLFS